MLQYSQKYIKNLLCLSLIAVLLSVFIMPQQAYADYGPGRIRSCEANGDVGSLESGLWESDLIIRSDDLVIDFDNPVCLAQLFTAYGLVKAGIFQVNKYCRTGMSNSGAPSLFNDTMAIAKGNINNIKSPTPSCTKALAEAGLAISSFVVLLEVTYQIANSIYKNAKICGDNWTEPNPALYTLGKPKYKQTVTDSVNASIKDKKSGITLPADRKLSLEDNKHFREWYYGGVEVTDNPYGYTIKNVPTSVSGSYDDFNSDVDVGTTDYDYGAAPCLDPTRSEYNYPKQRYYLKGSGIGNFNCEQYLIQEGQNDPVTNEIISEARLNDFRKAYGCCKERSKNYICIDFGGQKTFCKAGQRCNLYNGDKSRFITFEATREQNNLICAKTYSLCPYNFSVGGGSLRSDYFQDGKQSSKKWTMITPEQVEAGSDCEAGSEVREDNCTFNVKAGKRRNYCQMLRHCTTTDTTPYLHESSLSSPFFSSACINFTGDSRNQTKYSGGILLGSQRHFSAPIAQCVKETMENVFYNRFGHSQCLSSNMSPSADGLCDDGNYKPYLTDTGPQFKKGEQVSDQSFFARLQDGLRFTVQLVLSIFVMVYGINILMAGGAIKKSELLTLLLKMALVIYFVSGTAWQDKFFDGLYNVSNNLSQIVFKIDVSPIEEQRDGCQFGDITTANATIISSASNAYPPGKEYLALWDTLDCKIARYLGYGPEASAANIAMLIFSSLFSGPYGLYFAISLMFFGFYFIAATIRALHIFLSSAVAIIVMVFVSPIIIPTVLFKKTANIFKGWLSNLIGFCLQPVILFAYVAIFITILDKTFIGSATFHGEGPNKVISCEEFCADKNGYKVPTVEDLTCDINTDSSCNANLDPECDDPGNTYIDPMSDSFACLVNINDYDLFRGFEIFGIAIPILDNIFDGNPTQKVLTILKAAIVMYILCSFMDQIPGISSYIVGGAGLGPSGGGVMQKATKLVGGTMTVGAAIQKRARRSVWQGGKATRDYAVSKYNRWNGNE